MEREARAPRLPVWLAGLRNIGAVHLHQVSAWAGNALVSREVVSANETNS